MALTIAVRVKLRSRVSALTAVSEDEYEARLKSPPVDGKANAELIALVADHFGVVKAAVSIRSGAASRMKRVDIA